MTTQPYRALPWLEKNWSGTAPTRSRVPLSIKKAHTWACAVTDAAASFSGTDGESTGGEAI